MNRAVENEIFLVYDGECPVCNAYCRVARVRGAAGRLTLVDARVPGQNSWAMDEILTRKLDIDQGMVLIMENQFYYGVDAINRLALISSRSGLVNKINYRIFKSKRLARMLYPLLRACRNLLLSILGKTKIDNLASSGSDRA